MVEYIRGLDSVELPPELGWISPSATLVAGFNAGRVLPLDD